ncbi:hypothetical protein [Blastococcus saxobsidens]|uniref:Uncharacterized protein n=1 Tax=Blastococcus saxobsidens TaxID=138336 RepID=A0A4Q7Y507_9ACTN|nr:hypothetical protein [Blastococcus saxobsidens]RZU31972.1 hypothetical protein BKA19_1658 [Blastococcus saxobsidens]
MNRLAVHQSLVHPLTPLETIDELVPTGWDSMGLHVGAVPETEAWWSGGAGTQLLAATIDRLLETRTTVLDVGRVVLSGHLGRDDVHRAHGRVLDFGARLGAQFLTARFAEGAGDLAQRTEGFAELAEQARPFRIRPLLSSVRADRPEALEEAVAVVAPSGGGVVLDVPVVGVDEESVSAAVTDLWEHLGYVRVDARALEAAGEAAAGQLAVLPPHVPVVIGGDDALGLLDSDRRARLARLRVLVDRMLEHPRAREARERASG